MQLHHNQKSFCILHIVYLNIVLPLLQYFKIIITQLFSLRCIIWPSADEAVSHINGHLIGYHSFSFIFRSDKGPVLV